MDSSLAELFQEEQVNVLFNFILVPNMWDLDSKLFITHNKPLNSS